MFTYYRRILDKYGKDITAIVIYTGLSAPKTPDRYETDGKYGTKVIYIFNSYVVSKQKEQELLEDENPFSIVVLANLYVNKTKKNLQKRLEFKEKLYELAQKRGYSVEKTTKLFIFVNELMKLTPELEYHYNHYVRTQEIKEKEMRVLSQSTLNLINDLARDAYGKSVEEYAKESEMHAKKSEMQHAIIIRSIINLKDSMNLTVEQIASILELELAYVQNVLAKVEE